MEYSTFFMIIYDMLQSSSNDTQSNDDHLIYKDDDTNFMDLIDEIDDMIDEMIINNNIS